MNETQGWRWESFRDAEFIRKLLIAIGILVFVLLLWQLSDVLLLVFGAVLVAVLLRAFSDVLVQYARVPPKWGLTVATLTIVILTLGLLALFGNQMRVQLSGVAQSLPAAFNSFAKELGLGDVAGQLPQMLGMGPGGGFVSRLAGIGGMILGGLADFLLVVIAGIYIASDPHTYRRGLVKLFAPSQHERVEGSLDTTGRALKLWLIAQLISMTCVGVLTAIALTIIGVPSSFALGFIAGLLDFIPLIGPIIGAIPALLLASTVDSSAVLWTLVAFVVVQQIEGNVILPVVQRRVVSIPPALALFAIVAGGVLFGSLGLIVGFPLAVVVYVLVKKLYVRETLGEETPVPGEKDTGVIPS